MKIRFDGWSATFDYTCSIADEDLHPVGYCESIGHKLQAPKDFLDGVFSWPEYLQKHCFTAVHRSLFGGERNAAFLGQLPTVLTSPLAVLTSSCVVDGPDDNLSVYPFSYASVTVLRLGMPQVTAGMYLEVESGVTICAAIVIAILPTEGMVRLQMLLPGSLELDLSLSSKRLHPVGFAKACHLVLVPPSALPAGQCHFDWDTYLTTNKGVAVHPNLLTHVCNSQMQTVFLSDEDLVTVYSETGHCECVQLSDIRSMSPKATTMPHPLLSLQQLWDYTELSFDDTRKQPDATPCSNLPIAAAVPLLARVKDMCQVLYEVEPWCPESSPVKIRSAVVTQAVPVAGLGGNKTTFQYSGEVDDYFRAHGRGTMRNPSGCTYTSHWVHGDAVGQGTS